MKYEGKTGVDIRNSIGVCNLRGQSGGEQLNNVVKSGEGNRVLKIRVQK